VEEARFDRPHETPPLEEASPRDPAGDRADQEIVTHVADDGLDFLLAQEKSRGVPPK
jgi:hypothetical protein